MTHDGAMVSGRGEQDPRLFADVQVSPLLSGGKYLWGVLDNVPDFLVESLGWFSAVVHKLFLEGRQNHTRYNRRSRCLFTYAYRCYSVVGVTCREDQYFADVDSSVIPTTTLGGVT